MAFGPRVGLKTERSEIGETEIEGSDLTYLIYLIYLMS